MTRLRSRSITIVTLLDYTSYVVESRLGGRSRVTEGIVAGRIIARTSQSTSREVKGSTTTIVKVTLNYGNVAAHTGLVERCIVILTHLPHDCARNQIVVGSRLGNGHHVVELDLSNVDGVIATALRKHCGVARFGLLAILAHENPALRSRLA